MATSLTKEQVKQKLLTKRLRSLSKHDHELIISLTENNNYLIAGVDEVGRGSLIGPVVSACVVFPLNIIQKPPKSFIGLDDSKAAHLNHEVRTNLASVIQEHALVFSVAEATQQEVETLNIHYASLLASQRALINCLEKLEKLSDVTSEIIALMDGRVPLKDVQYQRQALLSKAIVKGDGKSLSIAAASVLAKVHRDNWVLELCQAEPDLIRYGFHTNMGYATPPHRKAIIAHGACKYHRQTFLGKILSEQLTLSEF